MEGDPITFRALMEDEACEHIAPCPHCGQLVDERELSEVLHHRGPEHLPLPGAPHSTASL